MGNLLDKVRKNRQSESTTSNSKKGLLETVRERKKKEYDRQSAELRMRVVTDKYNKSLEDLKNINTSGYSNQNDYVNRIAKANSIKREANDLKDYINSFGSEDEKQKANSYLSGISLNIDKQNRYRKSIGEYMTQWKDDEEYYEYIKAKERYEELLGEGFTPSKNYGESALSSGVAGAYDAVVNSTNAFLDMALGTPMRALEETEFAKYLGMDLPGEQIGKLYEYSKAESEENAKQRELDNFYYNSDIEQLGLDASSALGSAIPMAIMSYLGGIFGMGAGAGATVGAGASASQLAVNYISQLAKDPRFWSSVVTSAGSTYDSALDEGASYEEALTAALMNAPISGAIEVGSGLETQIGAKNTFGNWLKSALEEGGEEAVQGIVENFAKKAAYDTDRAVYSIEDSNAIINPLRSAKEFGLGALAGGVLSGAGVGVNAAYETYARNLDYDNIGKQLNSFGSDVISGVVEEAELFDVDSDVYSLGQKVKLQLENNKINTVDLGKLYSEISKAKQETVSEENKLQSTDESANNAPVEVPRGESRTFDANVSTSFKNNEIDLNGAISETTFDGVVKSSGKDINIQRVDIKGDKVTFVTSEGETVTPKDVALTDDMYTVIAFAKKYTTGTANTMLHTYKAYSKAPNSQSALFFSNCWNQMYKYGLSGTKTFDEAMEYAIKDMPRSVYEIAFERGQQDYLAELEEQQKQADARKSGVKRQGVAESISEADAKRYKVNTVDMDSLSAKQKDAVAVMATISKALGINTYFFSDEGAGKIHGIYKNGNVYLNINAGHFHEQAVLRTAAHELTHHIQKNAPKLYAELKNFIVSQYYRNNSKTFDALVQDKMDSLNLSMDKAIDEVIADACEMMLQDGSAVTELATKHKSLWENIKAFINSMVEKIKNAFKGVSESSAAAVELKKILGDWTKLQKMWNEALVESEVYDSNVEKSNEVAGKVAYYKEIGMINELTGKPVSDEMLRILECMDAGEDVSMDDISLTNEISEARAIVKQITEEFVSEHQELKDVPIYNIGTYLIDTSDRKNLREMIVKKRLNEGSFSNLDDDGKEVYNGIVKREKRLDIVIGLPASGKSSSIVNPLSEYFKSLVVDSDIVKQELPEFNDGWGANLVHEESKYINTRIYQLAVNDNMNIVLPIVGSSVKGVEKYFAVAKMQGYDVYVHLNELNYNKAMSRMVKRFFTDKRFIDPMLVASNGNKPTQVFEELIKRSDINGYSKWNNDVERGKRPKIETWSRNVKLFVEYSKTWRATRGENVDRNTGKNEGSKGQIEQKSQDVIDNFLTSEQKGFFKASKVRDDKGNLLKMYHGTPYGGFTVFKNDLNYFTSNKEYADRYHSPSASSIRGRYEPATKEETYEVYLNITKPFDINNKTDRDIFINEYVKGGYAAGINPYISVSEIEAAIKDGIDWTEADNLKEFFEENEYDYDGLILNEGGDETYGDRGVSYVTFYPSQVKLVTNENPSVDEDIRYSKDSSLLSKKEYAQFMELVGRKKNGEVFPQSRNGETIFSVGNKLVYSKGSYINPKITSVVIVEVEEDSKYEDTYTSYVQEDLIKYETDRRYANISFEEFTEVIKENYRQVLFREVNIFTDKGYNTDTGRRNGLGRQVQVRNRLEYHFEDQQDGTGDYSESRGSTEGDFSREVNSLSPRYILASTLMNATTNAEEKTSLKKYQDAISAIEDKETRLAITKNAIRTAIFEREAGITGSQYNITKLKESARALERSIDYWDKKLLELEATAPLKNLMERQRKQLSEKYMNEARTRLDETRARFYASNRREQIKKNANSLISWLERPDNNHYVPDVMKKPVLEFLNSIDFVSSKASPTSNTTVEWVAKMDKLRELLLDVELDTEDSIAQQFMNAVDPELRTNIRNFIANNGDKSKLSDLKPAEVEKLHQIIVALKSAVTNANKFYSDRMSASVEQLGNRTLRDLRRYKNRSVADNKFLKAADELVNIEMLDARSYFNMIGESGLSIYNELREGFNTRVFSLKEASEYVDKHLLEGKTKKERSELLKQWTGKNAKVHEFTYKDYLGGDVTVKLTTGQLMNLYCLSKREQAMGHITVGGIRIKPAENKAVKGNVVGIHIGKDRLESWLSELTAEEKQTAEMLQRYLSGTVSDWGNEVSQAMYGYDKFTEKNYWPIETDSNTNKSSDRTDGGVSLYQLKNMGMTKSVTPKANNPLMVGDIFDVFTKHISDMANYRGYVIPLLDAMKWYNYGNSFEVKDGEDNFNDFDSVKEQIERALGPKAKQYFIRLMQDINGGGNVDKSIAETLVSGYKSAAVGANLRVVIQQPTAYVRAAAVIDPKYLVKALAHRPAVREMQEHSGVAQWKSYGYYDTGIGQSLKKIITGIDTTYERIKDVSMVPAGKADDITWGTIWNACKEEIKDTNPEVVDTDAFMSLVTKRFDEVIDRTQVVDTVLHRTQIMRSKNAFNQMATSFMSEPSKSYNMIRNAITELVLNKDAASKQQLARTVSVWLLSTLCTAAASAVVDAFRSSGDDEDKEYWERYIDAFKENAIDNVNPLNMIPYLKEIPSLIEGYSPTRMDMEAISSTVKYIKSLEKLLNGKNTQYNGYYYVRQFAKVVSQLTGVPVYNVIRDFEGIWNSVPNTPKITTKKAKEKKLVSSDAGNEYMLGDINDANEYLKKYEEQIAEEYPAYSAEKIHEMAVSRIKSSISADYKEAYAVGSESERNEIISAMKQTGLYEDEEEIADICLNWEVSYWKNKYIKATSGADRAEYRRKLYATGKWKSLEKLDADIQKWIN